MEQTRIRLLSGLFKGARDHTIQVVDSVPASHQFKQLAPGKATPVWLLGHLTRTLDRLVLEWTMQIAPVMAEETGILFAPEHAGGTAISTDADDYPTWSELKTAYEEATERVLTGLERLSDDDLAKPIPGDMPDAYRERFPSIGSLLKLLVNHDAYHRGQLGMLAKLK